MAGGKDRRGLGLRLGAGLGAAALLALAAVSLNATRGSALAGAGPFKNRWIIVLAVVVGLGWALVVRLRSRQGRAQVAPALETRLDSLVVPGVVLMAVVTAVSLAVLGLHSPGFDQLPPPQPSVLPSAPASQPTPTDTPGDPQIQSGGHSSLSLSSVLIAFAWLLGIAALVALIVVVVRWLRARQSSDAEGIDGGVVDGGDEEALAEAVNAGQQALADDRDARAAIIACYAAMEASLAESGVSRMKADTPAELLERAVEAGLVPEEAARGLTDLFREARYSTHPMSEHQRDRAAAALDAIAAHLAAAASETAGPFGPLEEQQV